MTDPITDLSAAVRAEGVPMPAGSNVQNLIVAEFPRRTGMRIDPNEHWDAQATRKALARLDDAGIIARRDWLLTSCADMPKQHEAALFEYSLHLSRELTRRRISLMGGTS